MSAPATLSPDVALEGAGALAAVPARPASLLRMAVRSGRMRVGIGLTLLVVALAMLGPLLAPHDPAEVVGRPFAAAGGGHPLGTDYIGHDVLSRVLWGGRSVLWMSLGTTLIAIVLGVAVGLVAAYARNWIDTLLMRCMDVLLSFPSLVLALLFVSMLGPNRLLIIGLIGIAWTPQVARVIRGAALQVVSREYVESAEAMGISRRRILLQDVLRNVTSPLMVEFGLRLTWSIGAIASLSFLGFGIQPPNADWGLMINENRVGLAAQSLAVIAPVACIAVFTVGTNLMADALARVLAGIDRRGGGR